jgi:hypothetical protein
MRGLGIGMSTPRLHDDLRPVAIRSAISCVHLFVEYTLDEWHAPHLINGAVYVIDELVTTAVTDTGVMDEGVMSAATFLIIEL